LSRNRIRAAIKILNEYKVAGAECAEQSFVSKMANRLIDNSCCSDFCMVQ
jgi:hypothetical protein